jgi:arabinan endo-1,5-alpha-L-arabinosidase
MRTLAILAACTVMLAGCSGSGPASSSPPAPPPVATPAPPPPPPPPPPSAATYRNPVLDADFPDPAVIRASDGLYYAYATQTDEDGRWINIQVARSRDLVSWERMADALPVKPGWASRTQDFWAPHVAEHDGRFYLYYSAGPDAALTDPGAGLCLAVATAVRPEGPFTDMGRPLQCGPTFVNIDPFSYDDPATGRRLLYWGSGHQPIKVQELAADRLSFAPGSSPVDLIPALPGSAPTLYSRLVEGAWVVLRDGYYYLFYSGDTCCGRNANYAVLVARSRSATGPFETFAQATGAPSSVILEKRGNWFAPGHNSVIQDRAGEHYMLYHAVDTSRPRLHPNADINTRRVMLLDRIIWQDGWPRVVGNGPSTEPQPRPVTP